MVPAKQLLSGDIDDDYDDNNNDYDKSDIIAIKIIIMTRMVTPQSLTISLMLIMTMLTMLTILTMLTMLSTLRMLTGDEVASDGSASILGHQLDSDRRTFLSQIGYCPQFDSIIPQVIRM